ncbi:hypothetical protein CN325_22405 [Bacillus thuringiensis]|uniref:hypothetical protein n=1 Tax=Bacillus thuringiensis TaxID=1428 RepID=UPI000BF3BFF0|nr:hypothetical protein [Bacillus thuringiensis]PFE92820.1 hypothetical protein CN325_22405 [Bacillus thuringiensis]
MQRKYLSKFSVLEFSTSLLLPASTALEGTLESNTKEMVNNEKPQKTLINDGKPSIKSHDKDGNLIKTYS